MRVDQDGGGVGWNVHLLLVRRRRPIQSVLLTRLHARKLTVDVREARHVDARWLRQLVHRRNAAADDLAEAGVLRYEHEILLRILLKFPERII